MAKLLKVEFHCHTIWSMDSLIPVPDLVKMARKRGLDRLVITDHNVIGGAKEAQAIDPELVIIGEEILTTKGELLAFFVKEEIPAGLEPAQTIHLLRDQGAFISVSHPFDRLRHGWDKTDLMELSSRIDAIEIFNARCFPTNLNRLAKHFAIAHKLAGTAGSDAHALFEVGRATQSIPHFNDAEDLRQSILQSQYSVRSSSILVRFTSIYAKMVKKRNAQSQ